jgi:hypothetical protein
MTLDIHWTKVMEDLHAQQKALTIETSRLRKELEEIDRLIVNLQRRAPADQIETQQSLALEEQRPTKDLPDLTGMSVRWGILCLLTDHASSEMPQSQITDWLQRSHIPDPGGKLKGNVAAVLSRMIGLGEVKNSGNSYSITSFGSDIWKSIQKSPKYFEVLERQKMIVGLAKKIEEVLKPKEGV